MARIPSHKTGVTLSVFALPANVKVWVVSVNTMDVAQEA
jgi:hypothetical protein